MYNDAITDHDGSKCLGTACDTHRHHYSTHESQKSVTYISLSIELLCLLTV